MAGEKDSFSIVKLFCADRPTDRYISAEAEQLTANGQEVILVSMIEIANRWQAAIDLGNAIRSTFTKTYRTSPQRSVLTKFESTLKTINHLLDDNAAKVAEPIHCALAIFSKGQLYFSTINNGHILLRRRAKITQITGIKLADERFASVTSGELKKDDWLVIGSSELRDLLKNNDPNDWQTEDKAKLLRQLTLEINPAGYDQLAGITVEPTEEFRLETIKLIGPKTANARLPMLPIIFGKIRHQLKTTLTFLASKFKRQKPELPETSDQNAETAPPLSAHQPFPYRLAAAIFVVLALLATGIGIIHSEFKKVSARPVVVTPTIAALLTKTPSSGLFAFIEQNLTVDNYQGLSDKDKADFTKTLLADGITLITSTSKAAELENPIAALDATAKNLYAIDATGTLWHYDTAFTKVAAASVVTNPLGLTAMADNKIVVSNQAGELWLYDGSSDQPHGLPLPAALTQGPKLVQKFGSSNLYLYQTTADNVYKVAGFARDVFPDSQKVPDPGAEPPAPPTPTITASVLNFGTLADWVIPSDFIGVTENGVVKNFTKSKLENLNIQYYQDNAPIHLGLTGTDGQIAVSRGKFVSIFSTADGSKIKELALLTDQMITDISTGPGGSLYAAAGKTLYKIP